ncbi:MAG: nucleoside deaminase, partial [Pseudomonadota bacterium]
VNRVVANCDPTSHGEIEAMRAAGRALGTWDLSGCTLYATCEPCKMCVAAMYWARIERLFYACRLADVAALGFDFKPLAELVRSDVGSSILPAGQLLEEDGRAVLALWPKQPSFEAWRPHQKT